MKTLRILAPVAIAATLALGATACGSSPSPASSTPSQSFAAGTTMSKIQQRGKLIVGVKFDQPMFGVKNPVTGQMEGLDIELAKRIAKDLTGSEDNIEYVEAVTANREAFLQQNKVDLILASYAVTDERKKVVAFAGPYLESGVSIMVRKDESSISTKNDLNGKPVCTTTGARAAQLLPALAPQAKLTLFGTYSECAQALKQKRVDAVVTNESLLLGLIEQNKDDFKIVGDYLATEEYAIGSAKGDTAWHDYLDGFLKKIADNGEWKAAYDSTIGAVRPADITAPHITL
ncbi:glutamate transport system substrate-binding protein [Arthrobacter sp. ok909]|uniref:glutamate ABC transporter substrate-binding protein n=1 Tax=Arthrobacter sp. ok909 TaxID=1761746 RepID=UPI00087E43B1|nr:glutamate ABC transporter substrate-binding protein [Arthrobacter sp. ok909]SDP80818.1 glutamate transport system substrate-binding protein [Arthrobacter sp. ok909]